MTHVYYHPIRVTLADGRPATIHWRGDAYRVLEVNEPWHLMDRWWEPSATRKPSTPGAPGTGIDSNGHKDHNGQKGRSDRTYYRLHCASAHEDLTCDIYFEAISGVWILERVYD